MDPLKAGIRTSEFWTTIGIAILAAVSGLQPGMPWYGTVSCLALAALKATLYLYARNNLKRDALENQGAP